MKNDKKSNTKLETEKENVQENEKQKTSYYQNSPKIQKKNCRKNKKIDTLSFMAKISPLKWYYLPKS